MTVTAMARARQTLLKIKIKKTKRSENEQEKKQSGYRRRVKHTRDILISLITRTNGITDTGGTNHSRTRDNVSGYVMSRLFFAENRQFNSMFNNIINNINKRLPPVQVFWTRIIRNLN
jgi:hypothetical protein